MYLAGVVQSLGIVVLSAFFNIYIMFCSQNFNINPIVFSLFCVLSASWSLLLFSGPGKLGAETVFNFRTWIQGLTLLMNMVLAIFLIQYVSGAEVAILRRMSVPLSLILALIIFKRTPKKTDFISFSILLACCLTVIFIQTENYIAILGITMLAAFTQCSSFMLAESHQQSSIAQKGNDLKDKARVVSFANFVSTVIIFAFLITLSLILKYIPQLNLNYFSFIPTFDEYFELSSIVSGLVFGIFISPFLRYFIWSASYKIKSENVLTILALIPFVTFVFQFIFNWLGVIKVNHNVLTNNYDLLIFALTLIMAIAAAYTSYLKNYEKYSNAEGDTLLLKIKNSMKVENQSILIGISANKAADYEIVKNTIDFYEGDEHKAAEVLELPLETVKALAFGGSTYSLRDDISTKVHNIFRNKIFYLDQLTGVENKKGLIRQFAKYQDEGVKFDLYYMDINKFKQINDTLGHNVGDIAIIESVNAIRDYANNNNGFAYRIGGDEFAMLTTSNKTEEQIIKDVKAVVKKPISYNADGKSGVLEISISIGRANIIKDDDVKIKQVIQSADKNMYKDKTK